MTEHGHDAFVGRLRAAGCVDAEDEARLLLAESRSEAELAAMVERRAGGVPLEHVLGWAEFCGLRLVVAPGVFVPRRRTEHLVREAVRRVRPGAVVVDLCCGAGAIGAALLAAVGPLTLHATDLDPAAVACAHRNLAGPGVHVHEGDLYAPLPAELRGQVDAVVANVPYVPTDALALMPREARLYEARLALDGGPDGLDVFRRVIAEASDWLRPGGFLLTELSERQVQAATAVARLAGLTVDLSRSGESGATVLCATRAVPDSSGDDPADTVARRRARWAGPVPRGTIG
ncbi:putative protein N(5)-glutamine methyltransferase [Georgenia sp.]